MNKGLKDLHWWALGRQNELSEPSGGWDQVVTFKARWSIFGCPKKTKMNGRTNVCGARLKELSGPVPCGSYNVRRWMTCPVCGWKGDRELGVVRIPEDNE